MANKFTASNNTKTLGVSDLWQTLCQELYSSVDENFLATFRAPDNPANRFSTWPPKEPTFRYYLTLIFNEARKKDKRFFENYRQLGNTSLGQPLCVNVNATDINLDYLTSLEEYDFLCESLSLSQIKSVVEIGAGFGRTAHTLLKLCPNIETYTIVDLEPMLKLSSAYLEHVASDQFKKLRFISTQSESDWSNVKADLAINIDSFQEMPKETIDRYVADLFSKIPFVYTKNPVCKYDPALLGIENTRKHDVFSLGYMTELANIYNEDDLVKMRSLFEKRYQPSSRHKVINQRPSTLFSYYQHVAYSTN